MHDDLVLKTENEFMTMLMVVAMSVFGGITNFFKQGGPPDIVKIIAALVTSAFSGLLSYQITIAMGFDIHVQCIVAGIAGYGGGTMLDETYQKIHDFIMKKADDNLTGHEEDKTPGHD